MRKQLIDLCVDDEEFVNEETKFYDDNEDDLAPRRGLEE